MILGKHFAKKRDLEQNFSKLAESMHHDHIVILSKLQAEQGAFEWQMQVFGQRAK
jgi:hypothetical protein